MLSASVNSTPAAEDVAKSSAKKTHLGAENKPETSTPGGPFEKKVLCLRTAAHLKSASSTALQNIRPRHLNCSDRNNLMGFS